MYASTRVRFYRACMLRVRLAWRAFQHAKTLLGWRMVYINEYFTREVMMKSHHSYLFAKKLFTGRLPVCLPIRTFLNTGDVKSCRLGRPSGSVTLFEHEAVYSDGVYSSNTSNTAT